MLFLIVCCLFALLFCFVLLCSWAHVSMSCELNFRNEMDLSAMEVLWWGARHTGWSWILIVSAISSIQVLWIIKRFFMKACVLVSVQEASKSQHLSIMRWYTAGNAYKRLVTRTHWLIYDRQPNLSTHIVNKIAGWLCTLALNLVSYSPNFRWIIPPS